jgi:predicted GH43/DUF377 family glycosyl hydrolase
VIALSKMKPIIVMLVCTAIFAACDAAPDGVPGIPTATLTPYIIEVTATPQATPVGSATITLTPTGPTSDAPPLDTPTSMPTPTIAASPDPIVTATPPAASPAPKPVYPPSPTWMPLPENNLLANPGFEGKGRKVNEANIVVSEGWQPFFCAQPQTIDCYASRFEGTQSGNPEGLMMDRPVYFVTDTGGRVRSGASGQAWNCPYRTCRGGVYQTIATTPGQICEVGVRAQSWSTATNKNSSDLRTADDLRASTWYLRVDPTGGTNAWHSIVEASRPFSYEDHTYDQFAHIAMRFTAESDRATIFIENIRLWPFMHNESFIDDAYVHCGDPIPYTIPVDAKSLVKIGEFSVVAEHVPWERKDLGDFVRVGDEIWSYHQFENNILRAVSSDGIHWSFDNTNLLEPGPAGSWDDADVAQPTVIYDEDSKLFHMWYLGNRRGGDLFHNMFGKAISPDGIHWQREGSGPVLTSGAPGAWNEERIDGPEAIKVDGLYRIYYTGSQLQPDLIRQIGCDISYNGLDWAACVGNPIMRPRPDIAAFEGLELEQPSIVYAHGVYIMAFSGFLGPQGENFGIGLAISSDGLHWQRLTKGEPLVPLKGGVESTTNPTLLLSEDGNVLYLYYRETGGEFNLWSAPITLK